MASAMSSRTSRPSMEGRSSIMTGRSYGHSRQGSTGTLGTLSTVDMSTQTLDLDAVDKTSLRGMSPVRESSNSRRASPDGSSKKSPEQLQKPFSLRPDPLLLSDADLKRRDENPSPRSRLTVVSEDMQEDAKKDDTSNYIISPTTEKLETDLDRLARELRAMADEHEAEERMSQDSATEHVSSFGGIVTITAAADEDSEDSKTPQRLSARSAVGKDDPTAGVDNSAVELERTPSDEKGKIAEVRRASILENGDVKEENGNEEEEEEEDDDDDDDDDYDSFDEEPVIIEQAVQTAAPISFRPRNLGVASLQARAQIVSVHLPPPPKVPTRNPRRTRQFDPSEFSSESLEDDAEHHSPASSHDNDSTSSHSLDHDRDSFDDCQEIMTQTSQGSEIGSTEATPTREKAFVSINDQIERSFSEKLKRLSLDKPEQKVNPNTEICVEAPAAEDIHVSDLRTPQASSNDSGDFAAGKSTAPEPTKEVSLHLPVPGIPDRRRPFSFEVSVKNEDPKQPCSNAVAAAVKHFEQQKPTEPSNGKAPLHSPLEVKQTDGNPIIIPALPEDDASIYEEDFS